MGRPKFQKPENWREFGKRIRDIRENRLKQTQAETARQIGITPAELSRWETGSRLPRARDLSYLSQIFSIPLEEIESLVGRNAIPIHLHAVRLYLQPVTLDDLNFLIGVAEGLGHPMTVDLMLELLKCRQATAVGSPNVK